MNPNSRTLPVAKRARAASMLSGLALGIAAGSQSANADSFSDPAATGAWNTARWNNSADASPYNAAYTAGNNVIFTAASYSFAGMGASINVGNVTLNNNVTVNFPTIGSTYGTGGNVRTITVGSGSLFNLNNNAMSTTAGTGFIKNGAGAWGLGGANAAWSFTINNGSIIAQGINAMGAGGTLTINGGAIGGSATRNFSGKYTGGITVGGDFQLGVLAAAVSIAADAANLTFSDSMSLGAATRTITVGANGTYTLGGIISGGNSIGLTAARLSAATGTLTLSGANTFSGGLSLTSGRVELGNNSAAGTGTITLGGTDVELQLLNGVNVANAMTVSDTGNNKNLRLFQTAATYSGNVDIQETASGNFTIQVGSGSTLTVSGNINGSGGAGIKKSNPGILILSGSNGYAGDTVITAGTLALSGSGAIGSTSSSIIVSNGANFDVSGVAGGSYSLASGQSLKGNGTNIGTILVASGATLAPGAISNSIGTITFGSPPTLAGTLVMEVDKAASPNADKMVLNTGTFTYGGTLTIVSNADSSPFVAGDTFNLVTNLANPTGFGGWFSSVILPPLATGLAWDTNKLATSGVLDVYTFTTTVLELSTPKNSNAVIYAVKLANHATASRGTVKAIAASATMVSGSSASVDGSGNLTYTPKADYSGSDSFTVTFQDGHGVQTMTASVTVGTSSTGSQSANLLAAGTLPNGKFFANFAGVPGTTYTVEYNTVPSGPGWTKLDNYTAPNDSTTYGFGIGVFQISDPTTAEQRYYRTVWPSY